MPQCEIFPLSNYQTTVKSGDKILTYNIKHAKQQWLAFIVVTDPVLGYVLVSSHLTPTKPKK